MTIVPDSERHQVDPQMIEMVMAVMKQMQQEQSSSYTQASDTGTRKEQTAFETRVKMEKVNAMTSGMLLNAFIYETHSDREICRRFCNPAKLSTVSDPDIVKFQQNCALARIPRQWLNVDKWHVERVTPLGMGNPTIAQAAAHQLMSARGAYPPQAQQEILHEFTLVTTGDYRKAERWSPINKKQGISDAVRDAQAMFGTLLAGVMVPPKEEYSPIEQVETLLPMLDAKTQEMEQAQAGVTPDQIKGLTTVAQYISVLIQRLEADPVQKQRVKVYSDALGKLLNRVKGLAQRVAEARKKAMMQNGENGNGKEAVKLQGMVLGAQAKNRIAMSKAAQKERMDEARFQNDERRKDALTAAEIERQEITTKANAQAKLKSLEE